MWVCIGKISWSSLHWYMAMPFAKSLRSSIQTPKVGSHHYFWWYGAGRVHVSHWTNFRASFLEIHEPLGDVWVCVGKISWRSLQRYLERSFMTPLRPLNQPPKMGFHHWILCAQCWNAQFGHWTNFEDLVLAFLELVGAVWACVRMNSWSSLICYIARSFTCPFDT